MPGSAYMLHLVGLCMPAFEISCKNPIVYIKVVGDYINTMKATFDFNFDLYQAYIHENI